MRSLSAAIASNAMAENLGCLGAALGALGLADLGVGALAGAAAGATVGAASVDMVAAVWTCGRDCSCVLLGAVAPACGAGPTFQQLRDHMLGDPADPNTATTSREA